MKTQFVRIGVGTIIYNAINYKKYETKKTA